MSYNPPYYNSLPASGSSPRTQETRASPTNGHLLPPHIGRDLPSNESQSESSSYYQPPGASPSSNPYPPSSHAYRTEQQYSSPPAYQSETQYEMNTPEDYPSPSSPGHSRSRQTQATSPYPSASASRSIPAVDNQSQNPSHSHLQDEVYQLPTPPQTVYSPSSQSETSDSDSTITDIASPPNLDGLFSMGKNVDNSSVMSPEEAAKHSQVVDIKQEEKEGCIAWTDPMGNVHWLRALVRPALSSVVSFAPLNFIDAGMLVGEVSHTDLYKPPC